MLVGKTYACSQGKKGLTVPQLVPINLSVTIADFCHTAETLKSLLDNIPIS